MPQFILKRPAFLIVHRAALTAILCTLSLPAFAVDAKAARFYEDALVRYEKKDIDGAIIQLKNALQIDKSMLPVQVLLGKALLRNGEVGGAEVALSEALRLGVNRSEVIVPLAQSYVAQGKQKLLFEQPQFNPSGLPPNIQVQLLLLRAAASTDLGDAKAALRTIDESRILDARNPDVWLAEVPVRIRARQFREGLTAVDRALAMMPNLAEAHYQKGAIYHAQGDLRASLAAYTRALQISPDHLEARIARAGLYVDVAQLTNATQDITEIQRQAPIEPRGVYLKALVAERENNTSSAQAALREITELIDPVPLDFIRYRPQLLMLNGLAHFGLNEYEKAKPYLETFQTVQSGSPASKLLAQIYLRESNVSRAIDVLEAYLKAQPSDSPALVLLASAHMAQGRHGRATSLMQEALKTKDVPLLRTTLGMSLIGSGQIGNALPELEAAYRKDPKETRAGAALVTLYLRNGQTPKAVATAESLVKQQPGNPAFQNLLGQAQLRAGKTKEAQAAFEQAVKLDDGMVAAKLNLARMEIAAKSFDAAHTRLAAILKGDEKNVEAMYELAVLADRRGQVADAQRWLAKANDVSGPKDPRAGLALVDLNLRQNANAAALEVSKALALKMPEDLTVQLAHARAQLANNDPTGAKTTLNGATRFADFNARMQVEIANLQITAKNLPGAAYSLEKALSGQPDYLPAMALMTEVELRQGEPARAEKRARQIVEKHPNKAMGHALLGDIARTRGQIGPATEAYRRAHQVEPSTATLMQLFGILTVQDGGRPALTLAEQWLKTRPQDKVVARALADGYARAGNFAVAKTHYENLVKATPDDAAAMNNLANVLLRLKDPNAVKVAEQAMALAPNSASVIDTLGWALFTAGQTDRAVQLLRDARLREPDNPDIRYHLAVALAQTGRKTEALDEVEAALKITTAFESAADAERLRKTLR
jgi:cellulose synthase operon protein C